MAPFAYVEGKESARGLFSLGAHAATSGFIEELEASSSLNRLVEEERHGTSSIKESSKSRCRFPTDSVVDIISCGITLV